MSDGALSSRRRVQDCQVGAGSRIVIILFTIALIIIIIIVIIMNTTVIIVIIVIRRPLGHRRCEITPRPSIVGFKSRASALDSGI